MAQKVTVQLEGVLLFTRAATVSTTRVTDAAPVAAPVLTAPQPAETVGV